MHSPPRKLIAPFTIAASAILIVVIAWIIDPIGFAARRWGGVLAILLGASYFIDRARSKRARIGFVAVDPDDSRWARYSADAIGWSLFAIGVFFLFR
jgi:hypothetical protein